MKNLEKLAATLPTLTTTKFVRNLEGKRELVDVEVSPRSFIRDGFLFVSAEEGDDAADYYVEYRGGYAWINPKLEAWAKNQGGYWEWQDGGSIVFQN